MKRSQRFAGSLLLGPGTALAQQGGRPCSISLTLNMTAAKALGMKVPPTLLARVDRIIQ